jgi:hypothetical protein
VSGRDCAAVRTRLDTQFTLSNLICVYCTQVGLVWMELLLLGDGGKLVKLGVDLKVLLSELVPTLLLKKSGCVWEGAEQCGC